jgi:hypothetical protein
MSASQSLLRRIRVLLFLFICALILSGATAIPLETELGVLAKIVEVADESATTQSAGPIGWVAKVHAGLVETNAKYPFFAYGTDWLAFAHFVIAIAFIGPLRDPVKNIWVVEFGMIACVLVVPFALGMGAVRGIPLGWRLIDCSFGVFGIIPLWFCRRQIKELAQLTAPTPDRQAK